MRVRTWRLLAAGLLIGAGGDLEHNAPGGRRNPYQLQRPKHLGEGDVSSTTTVLADTGSLSCSGGVLEASSISGTVPDTLTSDLARNNDWTGRQGAFRVLRWQRGGYCRTE
ncbi:MAG TPA: hypothetical protein VHI54_03365 [Actinomycetota bacterium]|nr:hypothetical protein [Actinomycetota bacterium]